MDDLTTEQIYFSIETVDGSRIGKLNVPHPKIADWINFLVSPRQEANIISATPYPDRIVLYFQGNENLYAYLDGHINAEVGKILPQNLFIGQVR